MSLSPQVSCQSISKCFGMNLLFSGISIGFFPNERLGLIGPNGSGKTTFLKILANLETPTSGNISRKRGTELIYLSQEDLLDNEKTIRQALFHTMPDAMENWESDKKIREIIQQMGFENLEQRVGTLSGGWRKRVMISQALIQNPDLLFMDEPTNHLDLEGILHLEECLKRADFAFVLVSHDRSFLENTTNRIVELNKRYPDGYLKVEGNYSRFIQKREEFTRAQTHQEEALSNKVRRELEWLRRGPKARTTKAQYRIKQAGELQRTLHTIKEQNAQDKTVQIDFDASHSKTQKLIEVRRLDMWRSGKLLFQHLNFTLSPGTCLGILGSNGSGKSSLIHLLKGDLRPDVGSIKKADDLRIVTFGQKREQLEQNQTLKHALSPEGDHVVYRERSIHIVSWAKRFLFTNQQLGLPVSKLSGGEQARVLIANLMRTPADILLLDEPTNDLDIPTLEVLEESLNEFPGAIVLITHDRFLLDRLSDQLLSLDGDGKISFFADYFQWCQARGGTTKRESLSKSLARSKKTGTKAHPQKLSHDERKELSRIDKKIEKAHDKVTSLKQQFEDSEIQSNSEKLVLLSEALQEAEERVNLLYRRWEELEALNR